MSMQIDIKPSLKREDAHCEELIRRLLLAAAPNAKIVGADVRPLTGGLSTAVVAEVTAAGEGPPPPFVVRIDRDDRITDELDRYRKWLDRGARGSPPRRTRLKFPDPTGSPISWNGYSVLAFDAAAGGNVRTFEELCVAMLEATTPEDRDSALEICLAALQDLEGLLNRDFYRLVGTTVSKRPMELPRLPWETFLPVASAVACMADRWLEFVSSIPEAWNAAVSGQSAIQFEQGVCHGDLRCANILVTGNAGTPGLFVIDYGHTGPAHPLIDLPRLEADLLLRIALRRDDRRAILKQVVACRHELVPQQWADSECHLLRLLFALREFAERVANAYCEGEQASRVYQLFLLGHVVRFARRDDPSLRRLEHRHDYVWLALALAQRLLGEAARRKPVQLLPFPFSARTAADMSQCGVSDVFWGPERRNQEKLDLLRTHPGPVRLLAHTGKSYLQEGAIFAKTLRERLERAGPEDRVQIVLLNPYSVEGSKLGIAEARGDLQGPEVDLDYHERNTELFRRFNACAESFRRLRDTHKNIELRITHYSPDATILLSGNVAFVEPYLVGRVTMRYFDDVRMNAPELLASSGSDLYRVADSQFEYFWKRSIELREFEERRQEFKDDFMRSERLRRSLVALHESWFAVDPVVGCPRCCDYCFLTPYRINGKTPFLFRSVTASYDRLVGYQWFVKQEGLLEDVLADDVRLPVPVACGNTTEMTNDDRERHGYWLDESAGGQRRVTNLDMLKELVDEHGRRFKPLRSRAPILCLITKQPLPPGLVEYLSGALSRHRYLRIATFVSISFLPREVERHRCDNYVDGLLDNFRVLHDLDRRAGGSADKKTRRIAGIHFWRPLLPDFHDSERLRTDLSKVRGLATSSVAVGLKLSRRLADGIKRAGGLGKRPDGCLAVTIDPKELPEKSGDYFPEPLRRDASQAGEALGLPVFLHTSCAVSHAFGRPDYNATYDRCVAPETGTVRFVLAQCGIHPKQYALRHRLGPDDDIERPVLEIDPCHPVEQEVQTFVRQMLGVEVSARIRATHEWQGSVSAPTLGKRCRGSCCPGEQRTICGKYYEARSCT